MQLILEAPAGQIFSVCWQMHAPEDWPLPNNPPLVRQRKAPTPANDPAVQRALSCETQNGPLGSRNISIQESSLWVEGMGELKVHLPQKSCLLEAHVLRLPCRRRTKLVRGALVFSTGVVQRRKSKRKYWLFHKNPAQGHIGLHVVLGVLHARTISVLHAHSLRTLSHDPVHRHSPDGQTSRHDTCTRVDMGYVLGMIWAPQRAFRQETAYPILMTM
mmetsp:Transcript_9076/g.37329  ORF Transcript_9076/g.37329 Transcript_9076/m.37329 type:complete len:217 (+) Transcript_9076:636-1286(+)